MSRFVLGFGTALLGLLLVVLIVPLDLTVGLRPSQDAKSAQPEIVVPIAEWCIDNALTAIADSGLTVSVRRAYRYSRYPFVAEVATISTARESIVSEESSKKASDLANRLLRMCLPQGFLELRGPKRLEDALNIIPHIEVTGGRSWIVLEIDPNEQVVRLSRMPGDLPADETLSAPIVTHGNDTSAVR